MALDSLSWLAVLAGSGGLFLGGLSKGSLGIGLPLLSIPILSLFMSVPQAVVLLTVPILVSNVWQAVQGGNLTRVLRRFWPMALLLALGIGVGTRALVLLDEKTLYLIMGLVVLAQPALRFAWPSFEVGPAAQRYIGPVVAFLSGMVGGTTGLFGPLLMAYVATLRLHKDLFTATVAMLFVAGSIALPLFLAQVGFMRTPDLIASTLAVAPAALGILIGQRVRSRISQSQFEVALPVVLVLVGISLLFKAY